MATHMDRFGVGCTATVATLGHEASLSGTATKDHRASLLRAGWLDVGRRGGRSRGTEYSIAFPESSRPTTHLPDEGSRHGVDFADRKSTPENRKSTPRTEKSVRTYGATRQDDGPNKRTRERGRGATQPNRRERPAIEDSSQTRAQAQRAWRHDHPCHHCEGNGMIEVEEDNWDRCPACNA